MVGTENVIQSTDEPAGSQAAASSTRRMQPSMIAGSALLMSPQSDSPESNAAGLIALDDVETVFQQLAECEPLDATGTWS